jgi:hypothetical protein
MTSLGFAKGTIFAVKSLFHSLPNLLTKFDSNYLLPLLVCLKFEISKGTRAVKVANEEVCNLVQHVHLASLKKKLWNDPCDTINYEELLQLYQTMEIASDKEEVSEDSAHVQ